MIKKLLVWFNSLNPWLRGLLLAIVTGLVGVLTSTNLDPNDFHFSGSGLKHLGLILSIAAWAEVQHYLARNPWWQDSPNPPTPPQPTIKQEIASLEAERKKEEPSGTK